MEIFARLMSRGNRKSEKFRLSLVKLVELKESDLIGRSVDESRAILYKYNKIKGKLEQL